MAISEIEKCILEQNLLFLLHKKHYITPSLPSQLRACIKKESVIQNNPYIQYIFICSILLIRNSLKMLSVRHLIQVVNKIGPITNKLFVVLDMLTNIWIDRKSWFHHTENITSMLSTFATQLKIIDSLQFPTTSSLFDISIWVLLFQHDELDLWVNFHAYVKSLIKSYLKLTMNNISQDFQVSKSVYHIKTVMLKWTDSNVQNQFIWVEVKQLHHRFH